MMSHRLICLLVLLFVIGCKDRTRNEYDDTVIDREKIDKVFGHDVSQVLFDHLYVVLDSISYARLKKDESWKKTYAAIDKGLPNFESIDSATTSCYLRGHEHSIELLGPNNEYGEPVGKSGIGFSLRNQGEHFHLGLVPKLKQAKTSYLSISDTVEGTFSKKSTTWFKAFYSPSSGTALHTWYAFYNPAFLDSLYQTQHQEYSRKAFLNKSNDTKHLFEGINSIDMTCTLQDYQRIVHEMRLLGCKLIENKENVLTIASGDVFITISSCNTIEYSRINNIKCELNALDSSMTKLGNITITNSGRESIWNLKKLHKNN